MPNVIFCANEKCSTHKWMLITYLDSFIWHLMERWYIVGFGELFGVTSDHHDIIFVALRQRSENELIKCILPLEIVGKNFWFFFHDQGQVKPYREIKLKLRSLFCWVMIVRRDVTRAERERSPSPLAEERPVRTKPLRLSSRTVQHET